ncbi:hypothetical protein CVU37_03605 [candidate division BRC1 bacterium HGW-BRC1-1]|jgi:hypothetical protein|nr:MAG: hypothetical protein CVU37_03605 [candidate division BRC1 bacterium HGW-BRC1-1]
MATNPKVQEYMALAKQNAHYIALGVVVALAAVMMYMVFTEQTVEVAAPQPAIKDVSDTVKNNPNFAVLEQAKATTGTIADVPRINQLLTFNMFDPKTVKDKEKIEADARQKIDLARTAVTAGRSDEARRLLDEVRQIYPGNPEARELMNKLDSATSGPATPASDAGGAPVAPPVL